MPWIEVAAFTAFALALGLVAWWTWSQRQIAAHQAEANAKLAAVGRELRGVAHDLANLWHAVAIQVEQAHAASSTELPEILDDLRRATLSIEGLIKSFHGKPTPAGGPMGSVENALRLALILLGPRRALVDVCVKDDMAYRGDETDAIRLIHNLLHNAAREAERAHARVRVELSQEDLRVSNPLADGRSMEESLYEEGNSRSGSTGLGLAIARDLAGRMGLHLRHVVHDQEVTFFLERSSG